MKTLEQNLALESYMTVEDKLNKKFRFPAYTVLNFSVSKMEVLFPAQTIKAKENKTS
jgi:hypothetical protein